MFSIFAWKLTWTNNWKLKYFCRSIRNSFSSKKTKWIKYHYHASLIDVQNPPVWSLKGRVRHSEEDTAHCLPSTREMFHFTWQLLPLRYLIPSSYSDRFSVHARQDLSTDAFTIIARSYAFHDSLKYLLFPSPHAPHPSLKRTYGGHISAYHGWEGWTLHSTEKLRLG